ncbi:MAG TPA: prolyl oligopeptidase family serine peptidase [Bryobacteraceae bacterium]|jgi:dipeptidyl aminopeptidase/acylaminoacyl peptidase|nr:prolyl oligopeptidase family serine peptidase [Bryobacteraceae bacterium]
MKHRLGALTLFAFASFLLTAQDAPKQPTIPPPEALVLDDVPDIPASLAETAGRYADYRSALPADWHPTRREMLINTRFGNTNQLHLVKMPGGARQQLTFFKEPVNASSYHPNGGDYIVFSKDVGGGEWYQLFRYDLSTGDSTLLTDGKSRNVLGPWSTSGDRIAYISTRRTGQDTDLWVMNPSDPKTDRLLTQLSGGGWQPVDWSPDDKTILLQEGISVNESYLWLVNTATGERTALTPRRPGQQVAYDDARFSKDGKGVYVTTDQGAEFLRLVYLDFAARQTKALTGDIPWDVNEFALSYDGKTIALVTDEDGLARLHLLDTATGRELPVPKLPAGVIGSLAWRRNNRDLAFALTSAKSPYDCYSVNIETGKLDRWTTSETAVHADSFADADLIRWKSFDGKTISGFLYKPPARFSGRRPVLIDIHGGPEGQTRPNFLGRSNYYVNELGIAVITPNVRGSVGYGKTFSKLDNGFHREDSYKDIDALIDWIATRPDLDANRIAVTGGSYGGHMTLAISTFYSGRIRCSIDVVGMSNLVTFLEHTEAYRRDLRRVEYGDERDPKMRAFLEKIAPMNNIEKIQKPMLVVAGKNDPRVPVSESDQIVAALKKQGTPVWYIVAKDEGHGYRKKDNADFQFYASVAFLQKYLLNAGSDADAPNAGAGAK